MGLSKPQFISSTGKQFAVFPEDHDVFTLEELQHYVGGLIEIVNLADGRVMVLNEEGKLNGLPPNAKATYLLMQGEFLFPDIVVGDVIVCDESYLEHEDEDEPDGDDYYET